MKREPRQKTLIYRRPIGKRKAVGTIRAAQPGDIVTFFVDGRYTSREVDEVLGSSRLLKTTALTSPYGKLDDAHTVPFADIDDIVRVGETQPEEEPQPPEEDQAEAPPSPPPKKVQAKSSKAKAGKKPGGKSRSTVAVRLPGAALRPGDPGYERAK